jgi:hypothetical protein
MLLLLFVVTDHVVEKTRRPMIEPIRWHEQVDVPIKPTMHHHKTIQRDERKIQFWQQK